MNWIMYDIECLYMFNKIKRRKMIESPIRRKRTAYPRDFLPSSPKPPTPQTKFVLSQNYRIDAETIRKYANSIDMEPRPEEQHSPTVAPHPNP